MTDQQQRRFDLDTALRPPLRSLRGYQPIDPPEEVAAHYGIAPESIVKLDGNENPYGPSPGARAALAGNYPTHRYPDPEQRRLRTALAERHGVPPGCVVAGAGADEIIDLAFRIFVAPGDRVVVASPTFGMYSFGTQLAGAELVDVPRSEEDWSLDADALVDAASTAKVVFLPSPNNPTGGILPGDVYERLLTSGALVVIDEAYIEFSRTSSPDAGSIARHAADGAPLIVLRTFSKWAGLAGMRVGYGVMPPAIGETFMHCKQPYGVNVAAEAAALASLEDAALLDECARRIVEEREWLAEKLRATGWIDPVPSEANFLLCKLTSGDGATLREALARRGVFVRFFGDERLRRHVRISIGTAEDSERLLAALADARSEIEPG